MEQKGFLILENAMVFEGKAFGYRGESTGEVVFTKIERASCRERV